MTELTKENLRTFAERMAAPLDERFADAQEMIPMWFLESKDGEMTILCTPWSDQREKELSVAYVKQALKEMDGVRCCHISEVWTLTVPKDQEFPESIKMGGKVASHPERREAVVVVAEDKAGNSYFMKRYILRPEHKKAVLSPPDVPNLDGSEAKGLLVGMFDD